MNYLKLPLQITIYFFIGIVHFTSHAQNYPTKPIHIVIGFPPGGAIDTLGRVLAPKISKELGQPVVIDNKGGAGGVIGMQFVANAEPDGYTLFLGTLGNYSITPAMVKDLPYNVQKDFVPITQVASSPFIVFTNPQLPIKNITELISYAKANPGKITYGSAGVGSSQHLAAVQFMGATKVDMMHVPYKGTAPAEADLMAGHISVMFDTATAIPFVNGGKLKALGVMSKKRNPALPNVPTLDEAGLPDLYASSWYGLMGPAGMPPSIVNKLNAEMNEALRSPEVQKRMSDLGAEIGGGTPAEFANFIQSEIARYADIVKRSGAKFE
jgi:tripartite-type tricarboxylate transporter receptor subunit TctC